MIIIRLRALALLMPAVLSAGMPQGVETCSLEWKLREDDILEYRVYDLTRSRKQLNPGLLITAREISAGLCGYETTDIFERMCVSVPGRAVKTGESWNEAYEFCKGIGPMSPIRLSGKRTLRRVVKNAGKDCAYIESTFQLTVKGSGKPDGQLEISQWFSTIEGRLLVARYRYSGKTQAWGTEGHVELGFQKVEMELELSSIQQWRAGGPRKEIDQAVERGIAYLFSKQMGTGGFGETGSTALALAALLHSGAQKDDKRIETAFRWLRLQKIKETYDAAAILMAIEAAYLPPETFADLAKFSEKSIREQLRKGISKEDSELAQVAARTLVANQVKSGGWSYAGSGVNGDQSNTQFGAMGLKVAARLGIDVPASCWKRLASYLMSIQCRAGDSVPVTLVDWSGASLPVFSAVAGGWTYQPPDDPSSTSFRVIGTLSAGCLAALKLSESELQGEGKGFLSQLRTAEESGLAWLSTRFTVRRVPASTMEYYYYYLYALERVGVLFRIRQYGVRDWYSEGVAAILQLQRKDGSWDAGCGPVADTAFALLFLKRAVVPLEPTPSK